MFRFIAATVYTFCLVIMLFPQVSIAQSEAEQGLPFITNYSPKTYKAFPQNWSIAEDDRGIMYFGNQNIILEYDGLRVFSNAMFRNWIPMWYLC